MWYVISARDIPDSLDKRLAARPAHLARLQELADAGRVLVAGPLPAIDSEDPGAAGFTGSLMIVEFDDLGAAKQWAQDDPYVQAGVFESVDVMPFRKVLP